MRKSHKNGVIITDLHLRDDIHPEYLEKQIETLTTIVTSKKFDYILILGDIFEHRTSKSIVLLKFYEFLQSLKAERVIILRGNHDTVTKTDTTNSVLELFNNVAEVVADIKDIRLHHTDCTFIPHFEDEGIIANALKTAQNIVFGHFGIKGIHSTNGYAYDSFITTDHFPGKAYLGHIHKHQIHKDKVHVIGTQYTVNFGEANQDKFYYELRFNNDGSVDEYPKRLKHGIKHLNVHMHTLDKIYNQFNFGKFFTMLRVNLDELDTFKEKKLRQKLKEKYKYDVLDLRFDNILDKSSSSFTTNKKMFTINEGILNTYIEESTSIFTDDELKDALKKIYDFK